MLVQVQTHAKKLYDRHAKVDKPLHPSNILPNSLIYVFFPT